MTMTKIHNSFSHIGVVVSVLIIVFSGRDFSICFFVATRSYNNIEVILMDGPKREFSS